MDKSLDGEPQGKRVRGSNPCHSTNLLWQDVNLYHFAKLQPDKENVYVVEMGLEIIMP